MDESRKAFWSQRTQDSIEEDKTQKESLKVEKVEEKKTKKKKGKKNNTQTTQGTEEEKSKSKKGAKRRKKGNAAQKLNPQETQEDGDTEDGGKSGGEGEESDSSDSIISEELEVIQDEHDYIQEDNLAIGLLSRLGFRRPLWNSKTSSYFVIMSYLMSYDTLISFTKELDTFGLSFLMAYLLMMVIVGFPMMYMELALGQYTSSNAVQIFDRIAPAFAGLGLVSMVLNYLSMVSDQMIIVYFLQLFKLTINPFEAKMPWDVCEGDHNDLNCAIYDRSCDSYNDVVKGYNEHHTGKLGEVNEYISMGSLCLTSAIPAMFPVKKLEIINGNFEDWFGRGAMGQYLFWNIDVKNMEGKFYPSAMFLVTMLLAWIIVGIVFMQGRTFIVNQSKLATFAVVSVLFTLMVAFTIKSPPEYPYLGAINEEKKWFNIYQYASAVFLTFRSLKLGQGGLIFLGSQNRFHNDLVHDCVIIITLMIFTPFLYSIVHLLTIDSFIMYLTRGDVIKWKNVAEASVSTYLYSSSHPVVDLAVLVQALTIYGSYMSFILCIFSLMGVLLVLANKVVRLEVLICTISESFPSFTLKQGRKAILFLVLLICSMSMFVLMGQMGMVIMIGLETIVFPILASILVYLEIFVVCGLYGTRRFFANVTFMIKDGRQSKVSEKVEQVLHTIVLLLWFLVIPATIACALYLRFEDGIKGRKMGYALFILVLSLLFLPVTFLFRLQDSIHHNRDWRRLFSPNNELWGPRSKVDRRQAEAKERELRR